jgi:PIN domain nuclease of toxin-antitoxin system
MPIKSWLLRASTSLRLPIYKDPFDRLLVAPSAVEGVLLVTIDPDVAQYP